ncbi:MAG: hypothetical protein ACTMKY_08350 [Dermabacteraceae bacterium]
MLLAALVLLAPLSACAPPAAEDTEVAGEAHPGELTSQAPVESPTEQDTASEAETTTPATDTPSAAASPAPAPKPPAPGPASPVASDGTALAMLDELEQKGRAPKTGYDRDSFGWRDDLDRNGCDKQVI